MIITLRIFGRAVAAIEVDLSALLAVQPVIGSRPVDRAVKGVSTWWAGRMMQA